METKKLIKRICAITGGTILGLILVLVLAVFCIWHNEISTVSTFKKIKDRNDAHSDGSVYVMKVSGGYYFDKFLKQGGVSNDSELLSFITSNITKGLIKMKIKETNIGCSAFTAVTPDGKRLMGRNYDFSKTNTAVVITKKSKNRHASISTVDLQYLGMKVDQDVETLMQKITCLAAPYAPLDGINDAGVSCGIFMSYQGGPKTIATNQDTDKPDITSTTMLRAILDYADNVDEAVEIAQKYDLHDSANTSFHYMVADATGRSAILEWINENDANDNDGSKRQLVVHYNDKDNYIGEQEAASDFQWVTNFIIAPGYYDESPADDKKGYDRYEKIYEDLVETNGTVADEAAAMKILDDVSRRDWPFRGDSNSITVHSAVFNLTDKTMLWVPNEHYDDPSAIYKFSLK
ncbi:MAG: carcinine hydrolase/isopenicillin-N N-acyltransferase family protein [Treponema sp.]|nr:carcinine hydrolase/isopenicillin-N N-acyltransferase family protein [Treponema sp.]